MFYYNTKLVNYTVYKLPKSKILTKKIHPTGSLEQWVVDGSIFLYFFLYCWRLSLVDTSRRVVTFLFMADIATTRVIHKTRKGRWKTDVILWKLSHQHILGVYVLEPLRSLRHNTHVSPKNGQAVSCLPVRLLLPPREPNECGNK